MFWLTLTFDPALSAEPVLLPEAQFRPRFEVDSGRDGVPADGNVGFVTHRARLGASLIWGPIDTRIVFQDVRAWGEERDTRRDFSGDGIDLAVGTLTWAPHDHFALTLGREAVSLHDERLVAPARWRQPGRQFDGVRATFANETWAAEVAGYLTIEGDDLLFTTQDQVEPDPVRGDQTLSFVRGGLETETLTVQLVATLDDRRQTDGAEILRVTPGVFVKTHGGVVRAKLEAYGQLGTIAGGDQAVRAALLGAELVLAPEWTAAPVFTLSYDGMSGDADLTDDVFTSFDTLRGANHRYYGFLDNAVFFRGGPSTAEGLHDPHLSIATTPLENLTLVLDQHLFAPAVARDAGWVALEPDLTLRYRPMEVLTLQSGASAWFELGTPDATEWFAYLQVDVNLWGPRLGG